MKNKKRFVIYLFSLVGCVSLFVFGVVNYLSGNAMAGIVEFLAGIIGVFNIFIVRVFKKDEVGASVILVLMLGLLSFIAVNGGVSGTGIFWFFTFPPLAFYMKSPQKALAWMLALGVSITYIYTSGSSFYEGHELMQLSASLFAVTLLVYFYVLANNEATQQIKEQNKEMTVLNKQLSERLTQQEEYDITIANQNKELEDTKKAILNVLEDLQEEKSRDEAILANIADGLVVTNEEGVVTLINGAFSKILGWDESEVLGEDFVNLVPMFDEKEKSILRKDRTLMHVLKKDSKVTSVVTRYYQRKDGTLFPAAISVAPIIVAGKVVGAVEVFRDVTQEKAVDRAKTEFVSLASHQLRTPLSAIKWYTELLLSGDFGKLDAVQTSYAEEIERGTERMIELVGALLNVSRLELGTFSDELEEISLPQMIADIVKEHNPLVEQKKITLTKSVNTLVPSLRADKKLTRIVLENLISNAVKYTPSGGTVSVSLDFNKDKKDSVLYSVRDSGIGIPKSQQEQIFQKLFRADNAREGDTDGTGLGLYLVKLITEKMGGSIRFESEENKGTTFFVTLPIADAKSANKK